MNRKVFTDIALYLIIFVAIQFAANAIAMLACHTRVLTPMASIVCTIASSVCTIALFAWRKWAPLNGDYINRKPWFTLFWVVCLAAGAELPMSFAVEQTGAVMPDAYVKLFKGIMQHDLGFLAVAVLVPIAEEMLFRGAMLRRLLEVTGYRGRWAAIVVVAAIFGAVHGNIPQGINAFALGLLLGWLYVRTRSIVPGVAFHIATNSFSFFTCRLLPDAADKTVVEMYGGNMLHVWLAVAFSLMIFGAALYQLNMRLEDCKK